MSGSLLQPNERVLATLNADGTRRWLEPKAHRGPLWKRRRFVAWFLIAIFVTLPWIHIGGRQSFFIDIASGQFTLFGKTFFRTDTLLLALSLVSVFITIFLATALVGRVWCGWACPQTVYLEFVFRPIDRLFNGKTYKNKGGILAKIAALPKFVRGSMRFAIFLVISFGLANVFLGYFVGTKNLVQWVTDWPWVHPVGFGIVAFVTVAMLVDFMFFREQLCMVACPYGRLQSVMLDQKSLIIGYDENRGEPRGRVKRNKKSTPVLKEASSDAASIALPVVNIKDTQGDCVDCNKCVAVCPTGIDIRDGLQLECINCAQCIDACNGVMEKLGREPGLIRYASQEGLETGKQRFFRPRLFVYPSILVGLFAVISTLLLTRAPLEASFTRGPGAVYNMLPTGEITNQAELRIINRTLETHSYAISADGLEVTMTGADESGRITVEPGETHTTFVRLVAPVSMFEGTTGSRLIDIVVEDDDGGVTHSRYKLLGPARRARTTDEPTEDTAEDAAAEGQAANDQKAVSDDDDQA